jgi:hypothetical protein
MKKVVVKKAQTKSKKRQPIGTIRNPSRSRIEHIKNKARQLAGFVTSSALR